MASPMTLACPLCSNLFSSPQNLASHLSVKGEHVPCTHAGCTETFKNREIMQNHSQVGHQTYRPSTTLSWAAQGSPTPNMPHARTSVPQAYLPGPVKNHEMLPPPVGAPRDTRWSIIPNSERSVMIAKLRQRAHPRDVLDKQGYLRVSEQKPLEVESAPPPSPLYPKRSAVALDCEMVGAHDGHAEQSILARLSVIDFLTGEVIIDALVQPDERVTNWRTRYSGVTPAAMNAAIRNGSALRGHRSARQELWKHIDSETVIVGQSLKNDFDVMKIIHYVVVDSGIMTAEAVDIPTRPQFGLKMACAELLEINIQQDRRRGHDSVEDSLAAREVVLFCLTEREKLKRWAKVKREEHAIAMAKQALEVEKQRAERRAALDKKISQSKDQWPALPTAEELPKIQVKLPASAPALAWSPWPAIKDKSIPRRATWSMTISRSKEALDEALSNCGSMMQRVRLPPLACVEMSAFEVEHELIEELWEPVNDKGENASALFVDLLAETAEPILDRPLESSEHSFLIEPLLPSPSESETA
ncbi:hypothetical protein EG329_014461 [Mollisiaceae sp. DMI_Dod_QoI]|nr:hypothetical protein EG329_014461 [Helotiales sp. DMI_Dod_QoI]